MTADFCNVCELDHPFGTPHPEPIQDGPRTFKVRLAVVVIRTITGRLRPITVDTSVRTDAEAMRLLIVSADPEPIIARAFVEADIPEVPPIATVQAQVKPMSHREMFDEAALCHANVVALGRAESGPETKP
jgi:hypothetical protein